MESSEAFETLRKISEFTRSHSQGHEGRERLIRFLDSFSRDPVEELQPIVDSLCARFGLYPYMSQSVSNLGSWEAFAKELHSPPGLGKPITSFHSEQQRVYEKLKDGKSIILSAPTSFGKSAVIDALIASRKWDNIVLVVPTIALIDETRRRLAHFCDSYRIITTPNEVLCGKNIIVMTQERFMEMEVLPKIDFFMIDEFYKLGSGQKSDSRRTLLNLTWDRLYRTGAQYYLTGPNIDCLSSRLPSGIRASFMRSKFRPVAIDLIDRSDVLEDSQLEDLTQMVNCELDGSTLVFTQSPKSALTVSKHLASERAEWKRGFGPLVADWISSNYDSKWDMVRCIRFGVGMHTGPLPRSIQRIMTRLFNEEGLPILVCTSTLIEGVNTSAKNVVIYGKKIDGQPLDYFTFSNVKGRAGRMFRHYVGRVVTYIRPPETVTTTVDIPLETQSDLAGPADLIQIERDRLEEVSFNKIKDIYEQGHLSISTIQKNRGYDPSLQIQAAQKMSRLSREEADLLSWVGNPRIGKAKATLKFAFENLLEGKQRRGYKFDQLWGRLQNAKHNCRSFSDEVDQQMEYARSNQERNDVIQEVFRFHRNWMGFRIPSMLRALQRIQSEVIAGRNGMVHANYEFLVREIEMGYLENGLVQLEDYGLPVPLGIKLLDKGLSGNDFNSLLSSLLAIANRSDIRSSLSSVENWILDDVVFGVTGQTC